MLRTDSFNLAEDAPEALLRSGRAGYYAIISYFDDKLGRLLDCLEETGQRENTIVVCEAHKSRSLRLRNLEASDPNAFGCETWS